MTHIQVATCRFRITHGCGFAAQALGIFNEYLTGERLQWLKYSCYKEKHICEQVTSNDIYFNRAKQLQSPLFFPLPATKLTVLTAAISEQDTFKG